MIPEFGHYALCLALGFALLQAMSGLVQPHPALARRAALGQFLAVTAAFAALTWAYVASDFSVANVVENSHTAKPLFYKISGVWANHEGSMLLWSWVVALCAALFAVPAADVLRTRALGVQGGVAVSFLLFLLMTSNPFLRLAPAPVEGQGMNPLLQDPALAIHPPFLYFGYIGAVVPFALVVALLWPGRIGATHADPKVVFALLRRWTLWPWAMLGVGIMLGSWWAYYELGWGGWWFWDPVENGALLPWLTGTALFHSAIVSARRGALARWTLLLALLTFILSLCGAFLVRSGVLTSVHSFAMSPERGVFLLAILVVLGGGSLLLYAVRAGAFGAEADFALVSREGGLLGNNLLLTAAAATVFVGTIYPLVLDVLNLPPVAVGPPYFNLTFVPLMIPLVLLMAAAPFLVWGRGISGGVRRYGWLFAGVALLPMLFWLAAGGAARLGVVVGLLFSGALLASVLVDLWRQRKGPGARSGRLWGMWLAHGGLAIAIAGMVATSLAKTETSVWLTPGAETQFAGRTIHFDGVRNIPGPNYQAVGADLVVDGQRMLPEKRFFPVRQTITTEVALRQQGISDLYLVLGDQRPDGQAWSFLLHYNPWVHLIWWGAGVMALGGLVAAWRR
jgi:cytochrome c-type biogenesis protein CcmF